MHFNSNSKVSFPDSGISANVPSLGGTVIERHQPAGLVATAVGDASGALDSITVFALPPFSPSSWVELGLDRRGMMIEETAAQRHERALAAALEANAERETKKNRQQQQDGVLSVIIPASGVDVINPEQAARLEGLRVALGACANREKLFSTPLYAIETAFSAHSFPEDANWVASNGLCNTDKLLDIGCGDGRALVAAAKRGARAEGYEINATRADEARANASAAGSDVAAHIRVHNLNAIEVIDTALADGVTVVFLYLMPLGMHKVLRYLRASERPLKVVSFINPFRLPAAEGGGAVVPRHKVWCEPELGSWHAEQGVKFPIYCYSFGAGVKHSTVT